MIKKFSVLVISALMLLNTGFVFARASSDVSPVGRWKTIDDETGEVKSIIRLSKSSNNRLYGKIVKIYPRPGLTADGKCSYCEGKFRNKSLLGVTVVKNMKQSKTSPSEWYGGTITDPKTAKTYRCTMELIDSGRKLNVKGYIGVPLFGRTQTWVRQ